MLNNPRDLVLVGHKVSVKSKVWWKNFEKINNFTRTEKVPIFYRYTAIGTFPHFI